MPGIAIQSPLPLLNISKDSMNINLGRAVAVNKPTHRMETTSTSTEPLSTTTTAMFNSTQCFAYDKDLYNVVGYVSTASVIISLLAVSFVPFFIVLLKKWRFFNQRLILYLSLAAIFDVMIIMLSSLARNDNIYCTFGGFLTQIGSWMSLNAYICITATLLLKAYFPINLEKLDIPVVLFIFLSPFLFNWIPFIQHSYGMAGPFCWIASSKIVNNTCESHVFGQVLQLVLWYIPLYLTLSIMIILYIIILLKFCRHRRKYGTFHKEDENEQRQAMK